MTQSRSSDPLTLPNRPPLPTGIEVYRKLSTDHYPWTEVNTDLQARQAQGFSGVIDLSQGPRWARYFVLPGQPLLGYTVGGQEVNWAAGVQAMPRAQVTLVSLNATLSQLYWSLRASTMPPAEVSWPAAQGELQAQRFSGVLVSGPNVSLWQAGAPAVGQLPESGASALAFAAQVAQSREQIMHFWQDLYNRVSKKVPISDLWPQAANALMDDHPALDPFAMEIAWQNGLLNVDDDIEIPEARGALNAALSFMLGRAGVRLSDVGVQDLQDQAEWAHVTDGSAS